MKFKLKVRRGARALVMLIRIDLELDDFAVCRCDEDDFEEALRYAQSRVALPTFLAGGDFALTAARSVIDLRGVIAINATNAAAAARLEVPLLLIGGSSAVARGASDASHLGAADDPELIARVAARFVNVYA